MLPEIDGGQKAIFTDLRCISSAFVCRCGLRCGASAWPLYSNYIVTGRDGNANDTITIIAKNSHLFASWYDWFDDGSYVQYLPQAVVTFEKTQCDGPFNGRNATAATQ
jgi:hypothetical protein